MKSRNRSHWKRILSSPIAMCVLVLLAFFLIRVTWNLHNKAEMSEARLAKAQQELESITQRQLEISDKVSHLSTDQGIEAEIRTKFHAVKAGESVAVIVDETRTASAKASLENSTATSTVGWWGRLWRKIGFGD